MASDPSPPADRSPGPPDGGPPADHALDFAPSTAPNPSTDPYDSAWAVAGDVSTPPITATRPELGRFGSYDLLEVLAQGGMGVVYKAHDHNLGRIVALKMLRAGTLAQAEEVERFYREARAAAKLNHPNIVPVYEVGRHEDHHYFSMALVAGGSLTGQLPRFQADPAAAIRLVEKVARAVHYAHTRGILHRDLKPGNILLDERGEPQVSDFGLAKVLDAEVELTQTGHAMGTPPYMSPEQAAGRTAQISPRSDVWSLGVLLYELLTGRRPFKGAGRDELLHQILHADPPRPQRLRPDLDRALEVICLKSLEKDPAWRYPSAEALADDLQRWLAGQSLAPGPSRHFARVWRRHARLFLLSGLVLGVAALSALLAWLAAGPKPPERPSTDPAPPAVAEPPRPANVEDLQRRLARGEAITLVGDTGVEDTQQVWSEWVAGEDHSSLTLTRTQPLRLQTSTLALLGLLPATPLPSFRLRAEVSVEGEAGRAGLYFANRASPTAHGPERCLGSLVFEEAALSPRRKGGRVALGLSCFPVLGSGPNRPGESVCGQLPLDASLSSPRATGPWRRLAVEVTAQQVRASWDGKVVEKLSRADPDTRLRLLRAAMPGTELVLPRFIPQGGLGLYLNQGRASFRRVVVEPLAPPE